MKVIRRRKGRKLIVFAGLALLIGGYTAWALKSPLPLIYPTLQASTLSTSPQKSALAWPAKGQSAVGIYGTTIMETNGAQLPVPIASTAKMITALAVLERKPLALNQPGPSITLGPNDVALYRAYVAQQGSVVPVAAGEQITQYQMLQTMLIPSANNMADSLAIWAFGSLENYTAFANAYVKRLGLSDTRIGSDASGLHPNTVSTAKDLVKLGQLMMRHPVTAQIVGQSTVVGIPIANTITSTNFLLGTNNIIGIKTGNSNEAGGVFVSASKITIDKKPVTIITALVGEANSFTAMKSSLSLIHSAQLNFKTAEVIAKNKEVGTYKLPWGGQVKAVASQDAAINTWVGITTQVHPKLKPISADSKAGKTVGSLVINSTSIHEQQAVPVKITADMPPPNTWWRLAHP